jgi:hypothetical protein
VTDPDSSDPDSLRAFTDDLAHLRLESGTPPYKWIASTSHISKTVIAEAFAGKKLPSARTVGAIVKALDGDASVWVRRRNALASIAAEPTVEADAHDDATASTSAGTGALSTDAAGSEPGPAAWPTRGLPADGRRFRPLHVWSIAGAAFVVGAVVSGLVTGSVVHARGQTALAAEHAVAASATAAEAKALAPKISVKNGQDPADTKCVNDAVVAASATRTHDTQLQIIWSASCDAAWARITRYDGASTGNEVSTAIYRKIAPNATDRQSTTEPDAQSAYTTLLVRPTPDTELCAVGSITVSGRTISLGAPLCL